MAETTLANTIIARPVTGTILDAKWKKAEFVTTSFRGRSRRQGLRGFAGRI